MTLRLVLMRHAKSDWSDADLADHDRALNERGRRDCGRMGRWLSDKEIQPDQVLCSSAARAQETWAEVATGLSDVPAPEIIPDLYLAAPDTMLSLLQGAVGSCVVMVAHNPGTAALAAHLCAVPLTYPNVAKYPTLGTLIVDFDIPNWKELALGKGQPIDFVVPREFHD